MSKPLEDYQIAICQEYLLISSTCSKKEFCKNKNIGTSALYRWLRKLKDNGPNSKITKLNLTSNTSITINPIQVILNNGVKLNLPPNFCKKSLHKIIEVMRGCNA